MAEGGGAACCRCCSSFIFTSGLTALFMWLSLRTYKPTCSIQDFYVPALNKTDNSTTARNNHTIAFDLKLQNEMKDKGVNYANINMTFFYYQNESRSLVGNYTVPSFYQGHGKKSHRKNQVEVAGVPWDAAYGVILTGSTVKFRVHLTTRVKFKIMFWYTKRHSLVVGGDVVVDGSGKKMGKKGIKLKSGVPDPGSYWVRRGAVALLTFLMILFLLVMGARDSWKWTLQRNGIYTVKQAYTSRLEKKAQVRRNSSASDSEADFLKVWDSYAPHRVKMVAWRLLLDRLATNEQLQKRGMLEADNTSCTLCGARLETVNHLFFTCTASGRIWDAILSWARISSARHQQAARNMVQFVDLLSDDPKGKIAMTIWTGMVWAIWNVRNAKVFRNQDCNWEKEICSLKINTPSVPY